MTFEDLAVEAGRTYWYRLQLLSTNGSISTVGPIDVVVGNGAAFRTMIAPPGIPASGPVELRFSLARSIGTARLDLYDMRGRLVRNLAQGLTEPGHYLLTWDRRDDAGRTVGSGIYVLRLRSEDAGDSKKLVLIGE
jgi:flagellar hook assembly protein FlgD